MRRSFQRHNLYKFLRTQETDRTVIDICRKHAISYATFFNWNTKYDGMEMSDVVRMKYLQNENFRLKRIVANLTL